MSTPTNNRSDQSPATKTSSIFAHDYPIPVAMVLTIITYVAALALPFRFVWTIENILPFIRAHSNHAVTQAQSAPSSLILVILLIPTIFFFLLEYTVMRSYPPVSRTAKVLFITGVIVSSLLVALISPPLPFR